MKRLMIFVISFYIGAVNAAEETYLCVEDQATGFALEADKWTLKDFNPDGKFIFKISAQGAGSFYEFGENPPEEPTCKDAGLFYDCEDRFGRQLKFNRGLNRFAVVHFMPYLWEDKTGNNWLALGTCSKI